MRLRRARPPPFSLLVLHTGSKVQPRTRLPGLDPPSPSNAAGPAPPSRILPAVPRRTFLRRKSFPRTRVASAAEFLRPETMCGRPACDMMSEHVTAPRCKNLSIYLTNANRISVCMAGRSRLWVRSRCWVPTNGRVQDRRPSRFRVVWHDGSTTRPTPAVNLSLPAEPSGINYTMHCADHAVHASCTTLGMHTPEPALQSMPYHMWVECGSHVADMGPRGLEIDHKWPCCLCAHR